ncbi:N-formylglutamate amidohydrolase [Lacisediminimonas profundi]|uniref:N-formylglutamate amidohydrolase n=1 Tax=Lacisediminimonas profundi TaxID=2603856 RepID=UPI00124BB767|nr:N-formylglutamate amidohydrolase [Lacisediminimonas profundi]
MSRFCIVTCEHGGNRLPGRFRALFREHWKLLHSHAGYDKGTLRLARVLAAALGGAHHYAVLSRLLVDLNRSIDHPGIFSPITEALDPELQQEILAQYYHPYREAVERSVAAAISRGESVLHLSCHSFAEELNGEKRDAQVGLLFDPLRRQEAMLCERWQQALEARMPGRAVRLNYPYPGVADGLTTSLRGHYPDPLYAGIELEVRQDVVCDPGLRLALMDTLYGLDTWIRRDGQAIR